MFDSIDLQDQQERADRYKNNARKRRNRMLSFIIILLTIAALLQFFASQQSPGRFYAYVDGEWVQPLKNVTIRQMEIAADGTLWAIDSNSDDILHYDGKLWQHYTNDAIGISLSNDVLYLALDGNELWGLAEEGIVHFDGQGWTVYDDVPLEGYSAGIAAGDFGVVAVDWDGNMATFDGETWHHDSISNLLPWFDEDTWITLESDGQYLWLSAAGLARFDGQEWLPWTVYDGNSIILGQTTENLWLQIAGKLMTVDKATAEQVFYLSEKTGIEFGIPIFRAMQIDGVMTFAVNSGFYYFNGEAWYSDNFAPEPDSDTAILDAEILGDTLYVSVVNEDSIYENTPVYTLLAAVSILVALLSLIPLLYYSNKSTKETAARADLVRKRLPDLLPDMHEYYPIHRQDAKKGRNWWGVVNFVLYIVIIIGTILLNLGQVGMIAGLTLWMVLSTAGKLIFRIFDKENDAESRAYLLRNTFAVVIFMVLVFAPAGFAMFKLLDWMTMQLNINVLLSWTLSMGGFFVLFVALAIFYNLIPSFYVRRAYYRGDYEVALHRSKQMRRIFPDQFRGIFQQGAILLESGQWEDAEKIWREALTEAQNGGPDAVSPSLINLANALMGQGRYEEALPFLEAATKIHPEQPLVYREMAQYYQRLNINPERTLELTDVMMKYARKPRINLTAERYMWGSILYTRALALANVGRHDEAKQILERAFAEVDQKLITAQGFVHLYAGHVHLAMGDKKRAEEYYRQAIAIHPDNSAGQEAQHALEKRLG